MRPSPAPAKINSTWNGLEVGPAGLRGDFLQISLLEVGLQMLARGHRVELHAADAGSASLRWRLRAKLEVSYEVVRIKYYD